jgi:hypothetical protein
MGKLNKSEFIESILCIIKRKPINKTQKIGKNQVEGGTSNPRTGSQ